MEELAKLLTALLTTISAIALTTKAMVELRHAKLKSRIEKIDQATSEIATETSNTNDAHAFTPMQGLLRPWVVVSQAAAVVLASVVFIVSPLGKPTVFILIFSLSSLLYWVGLIGFFFLHGIQISTVRNLQMTLEAIKGNLNATSDIIEILRDIAPPVPGTNKPEQSSPTRSLSDDTL